MALIAALTAACGRLPDKVGVGIGTAAYATHDAAPYAALYLPYAKMAELTYSETGGCPVEAGPAGWTCLFGTNAVGLCPRNADCAPGLAFHVWQRNGCGQVAIAFKGTDWSQLGDVLSNFRWFYRTSQLDEYAQVQFSLRRIIAKARAGCPDATIVTAGHSLGGGLAQFAGYLHSKIKYVYAF